MSHIGSGHSQSNRLQSVDRGDEKDSGTSRMIRPKSRGIVIPSFNSPKPDGASIGFWRLMLLRVTLAGDTQDSFLKLTEYLYRLEIVCVATRGEDKYR